MGIMIEYWQRIISMTPQQLLAQGIVVIIMLLTAWNGQAKKQNNFILIILIVNILNVVQYALLSAHTASLVTGLCIFRNITFFIYKRKDENKDIPLWILLIFFATIIIASILTWESWISMTAMFGILTFSYGIWQKDIKITKVMSIVSDACWIIHGIYYLAIMDIVKIIIGTSSMLIWFFRESKKEKIKTSN